MNVRHRVELSQTERADLTALLSGGKHAARKLKRAQILLAADTGASDDDIATNVGVGGSTVYRTKQRFVLGNLEAALSEAPRPGASRKLSSKEEALLVATACSKPPQGRARWTLELLAGELVSLTEHASVSRETVRRRLAENHLKPGARTCGVFRRSTASMSRAWRMCSTSTPKSPIRNARWSVSMRARPSSSARFASRSQPSRARSNAPTANINATERSTCSSSSTPSWDSRTRWNNLLVGLAVRRTAGPGGHANSPHPSSREGHHSTAGWISSYLLSRLIRHGCHAGVVASRLHRNSVPSTQMRCMITANRRARATIAFFIPRRLAICIAQALSQDHFFERSMLCAAS